MVPTGPSVDTGSDMRWYRYTPRSTNGLNVYVVPSSDLTVTSSAAPLSERTSTDRKLPSRDVHRSARSTVSDPADGCADVWAVALSGAVGDGAAGPIARRFCAAVSTGALPLRVSTTSAWLGAANVSRTRAPNWSRRDT